MAVVHTDNGIEKLAMVAHHHHKKVELLHEAEDGHHGEDERAEELQEHGGLDPHIWLSPPLVKMQARTILTALQKTDPANKSVYETNFQQFSAAIDALDADFKKIFAGRHGLQFMVFHPAWGYFAHAYGLKQVPIEIEGKSPKPVQLKGLIEHARESGIKVVFVQPQFSTKSARLISGEIGGQVAFADPLAEDWAGNLRKAAESFSAALR